MLPWQCLHSQHSQILALRVRIFALKVFKEVWDLLSWGQLAHEKDDLYGAVSRPYSTFFCPVWHIYILHSSSQKWGFLGLWKKIKNISVANEIFKSFFTEKDLIRYYYFVNISIFLKSK